MFFINNTLSKSFSKFAEKATFGQLQEWFDYWTQEHLDKPYTLAEFTLAHLERKKELRNFQRSFPKEYGYCCCIVKCFLSFRETGLIYENDLNRQVLPRYWCRTRYTERYGKVKQNDSNLAIRVREGNRWVYHLPDLKVHCANSAISCNFPSVQKQSARNASPRRKPQKEREERRSLSRSASPRCKATLRKTEKEMEISPLRSRSASPRRRSVSPKKTRKLSPPRRSNPESDIKIKFDVRPSSRSPSPVGRNLLCERFKQKETCLDLDSREQDLLGYLLGTPKNAQEAFALGGFLATQINAEEFEWLFKAFGPTEWQKYLEVGYELGK